MELYCNRYGYFKTKKGRFQKGDVPFNKGRKWEEYATPEAIENMKKGWANLDLYRNKNGRSDVAGRCSKSVVAIDYYGKLYCFESSRAAFAFLAGGNRTLISRCCKQNHNGMRPTYKPFEKKMGKRPTKTAIWAFAGTTRPMWRFGKIN